MAGPESEDPKSPSTPGARFVTLLVLALIILALTVAHCRDDSARPAPRGASPAPEAIGYKPDFRAIPDPTMRKTRFFEYLGPAVQRVNAEARDRRARLLEIEARHQRDDLARADRRWLDSMAERYRVTADSIDARITALKGRLDVLPGALVIAQAAIESGWGTSRFAREGNNLFGEWCFQEGCGMVPQRRGANASHEVRWFPGVTDSIRSYFRNLNSHPAYAGLRERRAEARTAGREPSALDLAGGLNKYSERGAVYVEEVRTVIRANELERVYAVVADGSG